MNRDGLKAMALLGAALQAAALFLPVIRVPMRGNLTLMELGWAGIIVLVLAGAAALVALIGWTRHVIWPGIASLALLGYAYQRANAEIAQSKARLGGGLGDDALGALRDLAASNSSLEYGWAALALGAVTVAAAGVLASRIRKAPPAS